MPPKHKEKNTNRFLPFADRIANVNVDVIHRIGHRNEEDREEEVESYFHLALEKWNDLNCSQGWKEFQSEVKDVQTLAQLLLLQEKVVSTLLQHLERKDPLTVQSMLEMVVALARDLRQDFYPYYPEFLSKIISYLNCKEAEVLEWSFHCLAYLFKYLWRCMVRNIEPVLSSLLPLLSSKRPSYINYFAADSFAFLARKVKDLSAFVGLILNHLKEHPEDTAGCGRLVFAWLKGIKGQLHSCSQNVIYIMMLSLENESLPCDHLYSLLSQTFSHLTVEIYPGGLDVLWDAMKVCITKFYSDLSSRKAKSPDALVKALKLVHELCDHCNAAHVTSPTTTVDLLLNIYSASNIWPDEILSELSSITAILLMSPTVRLPQDRTVKLCSKVLAVSPPPLILSFVKQVLSWSALESLILPRLLEIVVSGFVSKESAHLELQILAELIQSKIPSLFENHEHHITLYSLDFAPSSRSIGCDAELISTKLLRIGPNLEKDTTVDEILSSLEDRMHAISILPHIKPLNKEISIDKFQRFLTFLCQEINHISAADSSSSEGDSNSKDEQTRKQSLLLMLFSASLEALIFMHENRDIASNIKLKLIMDTILPLAGHGACRLSALRVLNLYLSFCGDLHSIEDQEAVSISFYEHLKFNLAAPHNLIRELTCRVLCQLPLASELIAMFRLCLDAETTSSTITNYRDKLQYLQKLSYDSIQSSIIKHSDYRMAPLYFILGSLYINFQLLWEPLQSLIASHALGMTPTDFWPTFYGQLTLATEQRDFSSDHGIAPAADFDSSLVTTFYSKLNTVDDKPDHAHYRLLLWQTCHSFSEVCEPKNRDISVLFLTFMEEEYFLSNADIANVWDIKKHNEIDSCLIGEENTEGDITTSGDQDNDDYNDDDLSMDAEDSTIEMKVKHESKQNGQNISPFAGKPSARLLTKTLLAHLGLLSKMRNPRAMYREPELNQVYTDLLSHKNPDIQKAALDCLMTYKHKYLVPYAEHLFALVDNKSFKNEVTKFRIDKDSGIIQEEHRPNLIPIIMRLVYSKMIAKTGMRTGGKAGPAMRRALVLRFLAGCHEDEMLVFVKMAFRFFDQFLQDDLLAMVDSIQSSINLEKVVPPRRLQSVVNLLSVVQERFGGLMGNRLLSLILQLLTCVGATVDGILKNRDSVHVGFLNALRSLRTSCIEVLTQFFNRFEAYPWSTNEIDTILQVFVWPVVDRLPLEGVHSPTALMKLFMVWSQHPRYFILLGSCAPETSERNPMSALLKLLLGPKTHTTVCSAIMEILENLLTLKDHKQINENDMEVDETYLEERAPPIPVTHVLPLHDEEIMKEEVNLGSRLLYPHISSILERFKNRLASSTKKGSALNKKELLVLSYVSEFVRAPDTSATLTELLLPILTKRITAPHEDEEVVLKMMSTLNYLVKNVKEPHCYIRSIAALFSCINGVAGRKMLVSLVQTIAESSKEVSIDLIEDMNNLATVASRLNAYDKRWVEQPDFDTRLDAFKSVQSLAETGKLSVDLGAIVIHHCFYVIRSEKDMSLRDFASHCLRRVAPIISHQHCQDDSTNKFLIDTTILGLIRNAIRRDNSESVHSEAVLLLGEMARECSTLHPVLRDLSLLTNKVDIEVDFFENLQHLQLHRKTRALLKFSDVFQSVERLPNPRTLTQFILPLASQFICSEKYAGKNSLIDAAVKAIGTVCRLLPWHQYETCLRYYLGRLRICSLYQKQLVRIVMNILDAFHFDLSRAQKINLPSSQKVNDLKSEKFLKEMKEDTAINDDGKLTDETNIFEKDTPEDLAEHMDSVDHKDSENDMDVEEIQPLKTAYAIERQMILCPSAAIRVIQTITTGLLPQLQKALIARTLIESVHKVNKKQIRNSHHDRDAEEEEVLRVPMALAVVKLLQRLPKEMLTKNLPGVLMKLCTFLKSRLESVRRVTRETLQKVMMALGPTFLSTLLHEMTTLLTRGFQVHVLIFSIHSVLIALKDVFGVGDIDESLPYIIEVCKLDLFGSAAEEKEEGKVATKLHEAQSTKSYNTLHLTAQFVSENHLTNILIPFKEIIQTAHSHKIVNRASECLRQVVLGLSENTLVPPASLLIFAVGVASESIPALSLKPRKEDKTPKQKEVEARCRPDCFIIKAAPKQRIGITSTDAARVAARMNAHVFVEFGLRLIYFLLKHEKLKDSGEDIRPLIDPVIPLFSDCLSSQHIKLTTLSLQCLSWLLRLDLPSLRSNITSIAASIFGLLHKFAAAGLSKGDNFDLVVAAFKAVAVLVRDVKYHTLDQDQLKALLLYAEQDVSDANKHATAFALLKAILLRKLVVPEIHDVMDRVATLSITSELPHVRLQARLVFHQFLMDYPLGKKLEKHLSFYLSQLNYELQPGRESALEMVYSVINSFPLNILAEHSGLFFLILGARLVNDDVPDCRKMVAQCIIKMLGRLTKNDRDRLFNISLLWLRDKQVSHRRLAAQLCGTFVLCEKESFQSRLSELLPAIMTQFSSVPTDDNVKNEPGKFVRVHSSIPQSKSERGLVEEVQLNGEVKKIMSESERMRDHHVYQVLQLVLKLCNHCPSWLSNKEFKDHLYNLTEHAQTFLAHPHEWVRLSAAQILTHIFSAIDVQLLAEAVSKETTCNEESENESQLGFFEVDTTRRLKSMILDHCAQLNPGVEVEQQLLLQVVKNLVIFADVLKNVSNETNCDNESSIKEKCLSLVWLVKRMRKVVNVEVVQAPKSTIMRTMVMNWTAAVVTKMGGECIRPVLHHLLAPIVRELSSDEPAPEGSAVAQLRSLAKEVSNVIKKSVGHETFIQAQSQLQTQISTVRAERRMKRKHEAVAEPEKAAKRKIQKQVRKKESKKLRQVKMRGKKMKGKKEISLEDD